MVADSEFPINFSVRRRFCIEPTRPEKISCMVERMKPKMVIHSEGIPKQIRNPFGGNVRMIIVSKRI